METRSDIIDALARAATRGKLGLFVGSGFSKAVTQPQAPTWIGLLKKVCHRLGLDMQKAQEGVGTTLPRMASRLVAQIEERLIEEEEEVVEDGRLKKRALWKFKSMVAVVTKELQLKDRGSWRQVLEELGPAWIVTTNYDLLIEEILPHTTTQRPSEVMSHSRGGTPVYHMHGHQEEPRDLVITEEDYTGLFRPGSYRQQKLPILIAESVVLFLGYNLGDTNILTAIDLASMYRTPDNMQLVQALWKDKKEGKEDEPYRGASTETVVEVFDIYTLLEEIGVKAAHIKKEEQETLEEITTLQKDSNKRRELANGDLESWLTLVKHARRNESSEGVFDIISNLTEELGAEASRDWSAYKKLLTVIVYALVGLGEKEGSQGVHPALITPLYDAFAGISAFIDPEENGDKKGGFAWEASDEWHKLKAKIAEPLVRQLKSRAEAQGDTAGKRVEGLLERLHQWSFSECDGCGASTFTNCQTCNVATGGVLYDDNDGRTVEIHCHDCGLEMGGEM